MQSKIGVEELYPPFPFITLLNFHAVKIEWFECLEELDEKGMHCAMEVTMRKKGANDWEKIYEGDNTFCEYANLEANTLYEMRLRIKYVKSYGPFGSMETFETPAEPDSAFDLHRAIKTDDIATIQNILAVSNSKIEMTDNIDYTPLMSAVGRNSKIIVNILLNAGANANTANKLKKTALMVAANKGFSDLIDILIKHDAHVDAKDIHGMTALFYAVDGESSNAVRSLVKAGANVNELDAENKFSPLIRLACLANNGNARVGSTLLECGANVNHQDKFGQTALIHCAFHRNHSDLVKVLLQNGADISVKNMKKNTALVIASSLENTNFIQILESFKKQKATMRRNQKKAV